jgi:uncharacterized membrane protein YecN with MAPEG domain
MLKNLTLELPVTATVTGIVVLALVLLALNVSRLRGIEKTGGKGSDTLNRANRLHGNNTEHGLPFLLMLLVLELTRLDEGWLWAFAGAFLVIRVVHGYGFLRAPSKAHTAGGLLTYLVNAVMALTLIVRGLGLAG